ncbi:hypothetical protein, partial [Streptomyces niveus]|uniref:hypothetical protein n=1 Tax=Streptomyces niveus TaxID=193462 RepID=UPI003D07DF52
MPVLTRPRVPRGDRRRPALRKRGCGGPNSCGSPRSGLNAHVVRRWYENNPGSGTVLFNAYGPTEATTFALCHP